MKKSYLLTTMIAFLLTVLVVDDINAQRTRTSSKRTSSRRTTQDDSKLAEQWLAISLGNVQFGSGFSISTKFSYGFEFMDRFSIGASGKIYYDFLNRFNAPDENLFTLGGAVFARVKVAEEFYVMGEYGYTSFDLFNNQGRIGELYPSIGAGYKSGEGPWTYGLHLLFQLDEFVRDLQGQSIEFWIDFNYKF